MNKSVNHLTAIVLAAGLSKRMGKENKLLLPYHNKAIIRIVVENILAAGIKEVLVVIGHEAEKVTALLADLPVKLVVNEAYEKGMTTTIQEGVRHATGAGFMICLSDMVMITAEEYRWMQAAFLQQHEKDAAVICLPRFNNEKGNPVIFSAAYRDTILKHEKMEGCKEIVQQHAAHIFWMEMVTPHVLQDFDYRIDYEELVKE